jgi:hypothetical protein
MNSSLEIKPESNSFVRQGLFPPFGHCVIERHVGNKKNKRQDDGQPEQSEFPDELFFHEKTS